MDEFPETTDDTDRPKERTNGGDVVSFGPDRSEGPPELRLTVVENEMCPDRGTIHPPDLIGLERMETWLSVDASIFVELTAWR